MPPWVVLRGHSWAVANRAVLDLCARRWRSAATRAECKLLFMLRIFIKFDFFLA